MKNFKTICFCILSLIVLTVVLFYIKQYDSNQISARYIFNSTDRADYYGKEVIGYNCDYNIAVNSWQIFYADSKNIYLIADNNIDYKYCPVPNTYDTSIFSLDKVITNYTGAINITDKRIQALNSDYFKTNSNNTNMKAVAYMLDINAWNVFAGKQAEYAIGSPTIELFLKSYNEKYSTNYQAKSDEYGYRISQDGGLSWNYFMSNAINVQDSLYINSSNHYGTFLASPSCYAYYSIMCVSTDGKIRITSYTYDLFNLGFRPVVCLKSNTFLEKVNDNTFKIK